MKFLVFAEYCPENFEKVVEKFKNAMAEREKGSSKFPKLVFPPHSVGGEFKTVMIYDNCSEEQLNALIIHYMPEMTFKFIQLGEATKFIEQYGKEKKKK